jgi:hypothetical protein
MPIKLGELLLEQSLISPQQLRDAVNHRKLGGGTLRQAFVSLAFVKDEEITRAIARTCGVPSVDLDTHQADRAILRMIPADMAWKYEVLPLSRSGAALSIAVADPTDAFALDAMRFLTGYEVTPVAASELALRQAIRRYYGPSSPPGADRPTPPEPSPREEPPSPEPLHEQALVRRLSRLYGVPSIDLSLFTVDPATIKILPGETARKYKVLPLARSGATLTVAMADPGDVLAMDDIQFMTGYNVEPMVASARALQDAISHYYARPSRRRSPPMRPDEPSDKTYACLFASWPDESYWVGEVRGNRSLGIHVRCRVGRGQESEARRRGDANDCATTVAEAVDYLTTLRAQEVEQRSSTHGPPVALDAAFVESGNPLEMASLLKKRERAWRGAGRTLLGSWRAERLRRKTWRG